MEDYVNKSRLDNLREKPKEQKTAIAGGIAVAVVAVLLIGWAVWFLNKIARENPSEFEQGGPDFSYLKNQSGGESGGEFGSGFESPFGASNSELDSGYTGDIESY